MALDRKSTKHRCRLSVRQPSTLVGVSASSCVREEFVVVAVRFR